jgi:hypothetical protein
MAADWRSAGVVYLVDADFNSDNAWLYSVGYCPNDGIIER